MAQSLRHMIALSMVDKVGPVLAKYLVSYCGGVEEVFESSEKELSKIPNIGPATIKKLKDKSIFDKADKQLEFIANKGITGHTFLDDTYPRRLKNFETSPIVIYFNGKGELNHRRTVGIIGTRKPTERGDIICRKIVKGLVPYDVQIISGLAYGIDSLAHKYAVEEGIPTIGVLGHGHDIIYPATNRGLAQKMLPTGGTLTEFCIKSRIDKALFVELDDQEQKVVDLLKAHPEINIDELNYKLQLTSSSLAAVMINLEFKGVIKCLPGKKYIVI